MTRLRFPVSGLTRFAWALGFAATACALPAFAQQVRIEDIQISQAPADAGGAVSILVKLSGQPKSAGATQVGGALVVDIDGVFLPALAFDPANNAMVRHVSVSPADNATVGSKIRFEGAAFAGASTTIYRDAVLIEAKLAEASLPAGSSLMAAATPSKTPVAVAAPKPVHAKPAPAPVSIAKPIPTAPVASTPLTPLMTPLVPASSATPAARPADVKINTLESQAPDPRPAPADARPPAPAPIQIAAVIAPKAVPPTAPTAPVAPVRAASVAPTPVAPVKAVGAMAGVAKLDADGCAGAEAQLAKDAWSLPALGNRALCLIDQQKFPEAKNRLDQLAAFSPEDWRVDLGRGAIAAHQGDASQAEIGYRNAAQLAPDEATRTAIMQMMTKLMGPPIN